MTQYVKFGHGMGSKQGAVPLAGGRGEHHALDYAAADGPAGRAAPVPAAAAPGGRRLGLGLGLGHMAVGGAAAHGSASRSVPAPAGTLRPDRLQLRLAGAAWACAPLARRRSRLGARLLQLQLPGLRLRRGLVCG